MKTMPDRTKLRVMWTVATSSSLESGTPPYVGFANMLYDYFVDKQPPVELYDEESNRQTQE
jgi:hypothetical protein